MATYRTLADVEEPGAVLARLDLNSPVEDGEVQDNKRFERHADSVERMLGAGHRLALLAHQGRPGDDDHLPLEQHADILAEHAGQEIGYVDDTYGEGAIRAIRDLDEGEAVLLENVRFVADELADNSPEEHADTPFVRSLSGAFDYYVDDAYSAAHRAHTSLVGFPLAMEAYAGPVMDDEYTYNSSVRDREFDGRVTMVLGGTKAADIIPVMETLAPRIDDFLLGGIVGELCLRAAGHDVGSDLEGMDLFDEQWAEHGDTLESLLEEHARKLHLPADLAFEDESGERVETAVESLGEKDHAFLDVGSETVEGYRPVVEDSEAVFVKGALGVFEDERFACGTTGVLEAVAETDCFSVVGGGDTARAIDLYGVDEAGFDHVSIAGGAYIRALTGDPLPAVEALDPDRRLG
jgi:phosphoglycerate kinase